MQCAFNPCAHIQIHQVYVRQMCRPHCAQSGGCPCKGHQLSTLSIRQQEWLYPIPHLSDVQQGKQCAVDDDPFTYAEFTVQQPDDEVTVLADVIDTFCPVTVFEKRVSQHQRDAHRQATSPSISPPPVSQELEILLRQEEEEINTALANSQELAIDPILLTTSAIPLSTTIATITTPMKRS